MTWAEAATQYAKAADRAFKAGDKEAGVELITLAAKYLEIARNLRRIADLQAEEGTTE